MAGKTKKERPLGPPATSLEGRQDQLTAAAYDLAEEQILAGTASSQILTHFLKAGSVREQEEIARLKAENELLRARADAMSQQGDLVALTQDAINAFREYSGKGEYYDPD